MRTSFLPFRLTPLFLSYTGCFLFFGLLMPLGCSGSNDQPPPESPEGPPPMAQTQASPENMPEPKEDITSPATEPTSPLIRQETQEQLTHAQESVKKARQLLQQAPTGKDSVLALTALQGKLDSAETSLQTGHTLFNEQKYQQAITQAREALQKADYVTQQIEQAMNTVTLHAQ